MEQSFGRATHTATVSGGWPAPGPLQIDGDVGGAPSNLAWISRRQLDRAVWVRKALADAAGRRSAIA